MKSKSCSRIQAGVEVLAVAVARVEQHVLVLVDDVDDMQPDAELLGDPQRVVALRLGPLLPADGMGVPLDAEAGEEVDSLDVDSLLLHDARGEHRVEPAGDQGDRLALLAHRETGSLGRTAENTRTPGTGSCRTLQAGRTVAIVSAGMRPDGVSCRGRRPEREDTMFETAELGRKLTRQEYKQRVPELRTELLEAQRKLLADASFPTIVVFAGVDGAGATCRRRARSACS
jgi:hypothetical protein